MELKPGEATAAISERIARAGRRLAAQGWTQAAITEAIRGGKYTIEQLVELADRPEAKPAADVDAELREHLEQQCGWSQDDIDEQLELGWTLHDLLEWSEREDFDWFSNGVDEPRTGGTLSNRAVGLLAKAAERSVTNTESNFIPGDAMRWK